MSVRATKDDTKTTSSVAAADNSVDKWLDKTTGTHKIQDMNTSGVFHSDPEILEGTVVFKGKRVPLFNLIDYLEGGYTLDEFVDDFPSVTREQAV